MLKQTLAIILNILIVLGGITGLAFYFGFLGNAYDATVTKQHNDIERNNFEHSKSYVEGKIQDLSKDKREYERATSDSDKQSILNYVANDFSSFNIDDITDNGLRDFLLKARGE